MWTNRQRLAPSQRPPLSVLFGCNSRSRPFFSLCVCRRMPWNGKLTTAQVRIWISPAPLKFNRLHPPPFFRRPIQIFQLVPPAQPTTSRRSTTLRSRGAALTFFLEITSFGSITDVASACLLNGRPRDESFDKLFQVAASLPRLRRMKLHQEIITKITIVKERHRKKNVRYQHRTDR